MILSDLRTSLSERNSQDISSIVQEIRDRRRRSAQSTVDRVNLRKNTKAASSLDNMSEEDLVALLARIKERKADGKS